MHPIDARKLAITLMQQHRLDGWSFRFNRAKRLLGVCRYEKQIIELSLYFVARNDEPAVRDTILHEIAHALAGADAGHGPAWRDICIEVGAKPERLDHEADMPAGRWHATCPTCNLTITRHRPPAQHLQYACRACGPKRGKLAFEWRHSCS